MTEKYGSQLHRPSLLIPLSEAPRKLSVLLPPLIDLEEPDEDPDRHLRPEVVRERSPDVRTSPTGTSCGLLLS